MQTAFASGYSSKSLDNDIPGGGNSSHCAVSAPRLQEHRIPGIPLPAVQEPQCALVCSNIPCLAPLEAVQESERSGHSCCTREIWAYCPTGSVGDLNQLRRRRDQVRLHWWL